MIMQVELKEVLSQDLECLSSKTTTVMEHICPRCTTTLPSIPNTCNNPIGWYHFTETLHCPHSSLYNSVLGPQVFF